MILATVIFMSIVVPIAFVVMIFLSASKKNREDISRAEHALRNVYLYTLLIILLFTIIFCSIYALRLGLDIIFPEESTNSYSFYKSAEQKRNENLINLFTQISMVAVAVPLFIKHTKISKNKA